MAIWTEDSVCEQLKKRFPAPAFCLLPQVRNGTGFARKTTRTADALAISCYPSRGLFAVGIEIKVSLSDWRKELGDADKSQSIQRFCRQWYVAAPKGVVPLSEVPPNWGLLEVTQARITEPKKAPVLEFDQPDWLFAASVIRSATQAMVPRHEHNAAVRQARDQSKDDIAELIRLKRVADDYDVLFEAVAKFEAASGVKIDRWSGESCGEQFKAFQELGLKGCRNRLALLKQEAERIVQICERVNREEQH